MWTWSAHGQFLQKVYVTNWIICTYFILLFFFNAISFLGGYLES